MRTARRTIRLSPPATPHSCCPEPRFRCRSEPTSQPPAWQVLRAAKRSKKPLTGKELRVAPTRYTKDGSFLDDLVNEGLLEVVGLNEESAQTKQFPVQFRTRYKLTAKGEHAAEYGEYQYEWKRPLAESPVATSAGRSHARKAR